MANLNWKKSPIPFRITEAVLAQPVKASGQGKNPDEIARSLGLNPTNTFRNFVVGAGSELAHAACIAVSNAPAHAYNPLFIYGETGLGKTHLMHAVAHHALERDSRSKNMLFIV